MCACARVVGCSVDACACIDYTAYAHARAIAPPASTTALLNPKPLHSHRYVLLSSVVVINDVAISGGRNRDRVAAYAQRVEQVCDIYKYIYINI